ncbi:DUF3299 domain-containing protein [Vibrio sp. SS-MA-C1-2]|uniref:DUF3299 domain-containing protein n=1 Tax=Vibrio sp. SS-MA-C1-2 TaxID=2908646 RepID=UPI001F26E3E6|nr:DUF3299 domain-containing protein [Vibrio sp. SS-MA-C1-2]UJF18614.1 DUF3299 domain-containing protein [Vibrio sp. SS-MA-C1-2]
MKKIKYILMSFLLVWGSVAKAEPLLLDWLDLIPESEQKSADANGILPADHSGSAAQQSVMLWDVREELNGSEVKIPGFVIPLEGDDKVITEFLLVPYFGACIHVPPPPPNQIIYVKMEKGAPIAELWDVIYVVGTLKTETHNNDLAETGYLIDATRIEAYDDM